MGTAAGQSIAECRLLLDIKLVLTLLISQPSFLLNAAFQPSAIFLFSTENWLRPADEVKYLMNLLAAGNMPRE